MNFKQYIIIALVVLLAACTGKEHVPNHSMQMTEQNPETAPAPFSPGLIAEDELIHRGVFSPDFTSYYYTVSDRNFSSFEMRCINKSGNTWSKPQEAFFNSKYKEHGMSFSPDGKTLYFSSTRPVPIKGIPDTWHLWKCEKVAGKWSEAEYIDIPNLRDKLQSHPTVTNDGTLYFHVSNTDYSEVDIYYSTYKDGKYQDAKRVKLNTPANAGRCTPYIAADGSFLMYATIGEELKLEICYKKGQNEWYPSRELPAFINQNGQGNPCITPDGECLLYAKEKPEEGKWSIKWVKTDSFLKQK